MASKRGLALLLDAGIPTRKHDEPDGDEPGSEEGRDEEYELDPGEVSAAEDICRALDVPEDKAEEVGKAICRFIDVHTDVHK